MTWDKIRIIINEFKFVKKFSGSTSASLGRWKLKNNNEIDYYMTKMHADPGYNLNRPWKNLQNYPIPKK